MPICADATAFRAAPESMNVTWRFQQRPGVSYARIKVDGAEAVVRPLDAGGPRKLVIMRLCAAKPEAEQRVLRAVMGHAAACRARFVIYRPGLGVSHSSYVFRPDCCRAMPIVARELPDCTAFDAADWDVL
jgi:hypothetical protein